jgi:tRNA dimethylallyltransferase
VISLLPLVAVVGPTGAGKSELALRIAEEAGGEIVNCDSLQIYRHFYIGTAKLSTAERRGIPHFLIDICDPDETFTAGEYARRGRECLQEISARGKLPILCGGTGFYLRALLKGLAPAPDRNEALRVNLTGREARRPGSLHRILQRLDGGAGERIHPNDVNKIIRALEMRVVTGRSSADLFAAGEEALMGYRLLQIGLSPPRQLLYDRINERSEAMFHGGLMEEVEMILGLGYSEAVKPFEALAYKQALAVRAGKMTIAEAIADTQLKTRHYAKRQMTWFRREAEVAWVDGFGSQTNVQQIALARVTHFLKDSSNI